MDFHRAWMATRKGLERRLTDTLSIAPAEAACKKGRSGEGAYIPMILPAGKAATN